MREKQQQKEQRQLLSRQCRADTWGVRDGESELSFQLGSASQAIATI